MKITVLIIVVLLLSSCSEIQETQDVKLETIVKSALIVKSDVIRYHQVPAVFMAVNRADLAFQLSGTVDKILVKIGQEVEADQALMSVYNPNIDPALESNFAKLESLKVQIEQVRRDEDKLIELRKKNSTSKIALEQKQTDLKDLLAQRKLVQSQINLALANQSESIIKAPFDGTVIASFKQTGEFVQAGQVVMTVYQQDVIEVEVNITQLLWKNLKFGDEIRGQYLGQTIKFNVAELAQTADSQSHLMKVILQLNQKIAHAIGQQVMLSFPQNYNEVYQLPLETIVDDGINQPYIFTIVNDEAVKNQIIPLYIENGQIVFKTNEAIIGSVIFKGQSKLSAGMKVKVL